MFNIDLNTKNEGVFLELIKMGMWEVRADFVARDVYEAIKQSVELHKKEFHSIATGEWFVNFDDVQVQLFVSIRSLGAVTKTSFNL